MGRRPATLGGEVEIRDTESGARIHAFATQQTYRDHDVAFVDEGRIAVAAVSYASGLVWWWDTASGAPLASPTEGIACAWASARREVDCIVRPAGGGVVSRDYRALRRIDAHGAVVWEAPIDHGWGQVTTSADGRWAVTTGDDSEALVVWDGETGARVARWDCNALPTCVAVTATGEIALGDAGGDITLLRLVLPG